MIQVPDEFLRAVVDFDAAAGRRVRHRPGLPARPTTPTRPARVTGAGEVRAGRGRRGARLAGRAGRPDRARRDRAGARCPRIRQVFLAAHRLTDSPAGPAGEPLAGLELDRVAFCVRKQAERETRERGVPAVLPVAVRRAPSSTRACSPRTSCPTFFPDLSDERVVSAIALVHSRFSTNTFPSLAAGPPVPVHRAQRRDQHHPRQPELDGRPARRCCASRPDPGRHPPAVPDLHAGRLRLGQLRRGAGAAAPGRAQPAARGADDDPGGVGERPGDGRRQRRASTASTPA